jgi:hypothetical protein
VNVFVSEEKSNVIPFPSVGRKDIEFGFTVQEDLLFSCLLDNFGKVVPNLTLHQRMSLCGRKDNIDIKNNLLSVVISKINKKLKDYNQDIKIHLKKGVGYILEKNEFQVPVVNEYVRGSKVFTGESIYTWTEKRKRLLVAEIRKGLLSVEQASLISLISVEEISTWMNSKKTDLFITKRQIKRAAA